MIKSNLGLASVHHLMFRREEMWFPFQASTNRIKLRLQISVNNEITVEESQWSQVQTYTS